MTLLGTITRRANTTRSSIVQQADRNLFDVLPFGALHVDGTGRILRHNPLDWMPQHPRHHDLTGIDFFHDLCAGTPLELWGEVFREGIRNGSLYRFVTLSFNLVTGPREVTFLFYYHQQTGEAWIFIDPRPLPKAAASTGQMAA